MRRLYLLHFFGNAALAVLIYEWLGIPDAKALDLAATFVLGLSILFFALWLQSGSLVWFRDQQPAELKPSFQSALRKLPAFAVAVLLTLILYWLINWLETITYSPATHFASWLTLKLRVPVPPARMYEGVQAGIWAVRWLIAPAYVLPFLSAAAAHGWLAFRGTGHRDSPRYYWLKCVALTLVIVYIPALLIHWTPELKTIPMETASLAIRFLAAYLIFEAAWVALMFLSSGGRPRVTQPSTAGLP
jgi:hypothetical protein